MYKADPSNDTVCHGISANDGVLAEYPNSVRRPVRHGNVCEVSGLAQVCGLANDVE